MAAYLADRGHLAEAARVGATCSMLWERDAELWAVLARAAYGKWKWTRLHWACEEGDLERVERLLEWKSDIKAADGEGRTPLHLASLNGHLEVVRELVRRGAKVRAEDKNGDTPLHDASFYGYVEVARLLLDSGADIEAKTSTDTDIGATSLFSASQEGTLEVVQLLVARGAVVDARAEDGWTSLMKASEKGHAPVVRALLAAGADVRARNNRSYTALHWASYHGHTEALRELLKSHDAELNAQDEDGDTPLTDACAMGHLMAATLLISFGADINLLNHAGASALQVAETLSAEDGDESDNDDDDDDETSLPAQHRQIVRCSRRSARLEERPVSVIALRRVHWTRIFYYNYEKKKDRHLYNN